MHYEIQDIIIEQYREETISEDIQHLVHERLKLPEKRLSKYARSKRLEALNEALGWSKGLNQNNRIFTELYQIDEYALGVSKPGKEAAPDYTGCRHYKTGEKTNNPNDMHPLILKSGEIIEDNLSFQDIFEIIERLMRADYFGLELMGMILFRAAFMLDHKKNEEGKWRFHPPRDIINIIEERIPPIENLPIRVLLHFVEILSLNEDVKVYTLGYNELKQDYGRINTLLTFVHLVAVILNRSSLGKFAGSFARPPSGMAPIAKTKIAKYFPLFENSKITL